MISDLQMQSGPARTNVTSPGQERQSVRGKLATSKKFLPRMLRCAYRAVRAFSMPAPRVLSLKPLLWLFLAVRESYQFACAYSSASRCSKRIARNTARVCERIAICIGCKARETSFLATM